MAVELVPKLAGGDSSRQRAIDLRDPAFGVVAVRRGPRGVSDRAVEAEVVPDLLDLPQLAIGVDV
jgi:hypothetical protein